MKDIELKSDGDVDFSSTVGDGSEIMQSIRIILETNLGDFIGDEDMGLDTSNLLSKDYDEQYATAAIREALEQESRVSAINSITLVADRAKRVVNVKLDVVIDDNQQKTEVTIDVG